MAHSNAGLVPSQKKVGIFSQAGYQKKSFFAKIKMLFIILAKPFIKLADDLSGEIKRTENKKKITKIIIKKCLLPIAVACIFILGITATYIYFKDVLREAKSFEITIDDITDLAVEETFDAYQADKEEAEQETEQEEEEEEEVLFG